MGKRCPVGNRCIASDRRCVCVCARARAYVRVFVRVRVYGKGICAHACTGVCMGKHCPIGVVPVSALVRATYATMAVNISMPPPLHR
jgi:hypothetical protein